MKKGKIENVVIGKGECTTVENYRGEAIGWALPGGFMTTDSDRACEYALMVNDAFVERSKREIKK